MTEVIAIEPCLVHPVIHLEWQEHFDEEQCYKAMEAHQEAS